MTKLIIVVVGGDGDYRHGVESDENVGGGGDNWW